MTDTRVETTSRLAQWRIDNLGLSTYRKSDPFKIGKWNWRLVLEKNRNLSIRLYPEISSLNKDSHPIASFIIRVVCSLGGRKALVHPEVRDKQLKSGEDFVWPLEVPLGGRFIIDVEFLDLKTTYQNGGESYSVWTEHFTQKDLCATALSSIGKMLSDSIHTDIIINASNGSIGAHRAIMAARSPVFKTMFSHDLKEKEMSVINISDMSIESCQVFLNYIYGNIIDQDFFTHRLDLLRAADKYDVTDLKEACHESLLDDIDANNVLERLQYSSLYHLPKLKICCMQYLVRFGKIFDIVEDFNVFIQSADRELIGEVFSEVLSVWKGF
ncbi:hypothetical protein QVD17_27116 [Tagetes erecta]|uniref:BTB domain-containing protein n=1 Tax=Tagetes erecta TaxID=13708 RepID=A0AAD8K7U6_TARER|nr:hypothetical protein QVD17_27116 [Tagetes erecta]